MRKLKAEEVSLLDLCKQCINDKWMMPVSLLCSIDKTWHVIHFVLTGGERDTVLAKMIFSENYVNGEDMGYGPAALVTPEEVNEINLALKGIAKEWFRERFFVRDMFANEIYPVMEGEDENDFFEYVYHYFEEAKAFFEEAAKDGQCVLFFIG